MIVETIEQMMVRLNCKGEFISQKNIIDRIVKVEHVVTEVCGQKFIHAYIQMDNNFVVSGEPSVCIDLSNFREEIGKKISFDNAFENIYKLEAYRFVSDKQSRFEYIASQCHFVNREYCKSIGDHSIAPWSELSKESKASMIDGVKSQIDNPDRTSREIHEQWLKSKQANGWVYGETKNETLKTHPCIAPYESLPVSHRIKDVLFATTVRTELKKYV